MHLLIAAAGSGKRMGANCNKLLLQLAGRPVLYWTLEAVCSAKSISWVAIVGQPIDKVPIMELVKDLSMPVHWINGGKTRQESVQLGLAGLPVDAKKVLIHDGARCLVKPDLLERCSQALLQGEAVIAATPVTDTVKRVDADRVIIDTPERSMLWAAQTPQGFSVSELSRAHCEALDNEWVVTDDASLFERLGWPVHVIESDPSNIKVTTPFDLTIAQAVLASRAKV